MSTNERIRDDADEMKRPQINAEKQGGMMLFLEGETSTCWMAIDADAVVEVEA